MKGIPARHWLALVGAAALLTEGTPARATFVNNDFGLTSPVQVVTFDEHILAQNASVTTQYSDLGVTFAGAFYDPDVSNLVHVVGHRLGNFIPSTPVSAFSMHFNARQTRAAVAMATQPGTSTFTALLNGVVVETGNAATSLSNPNDFFGFEGILFDEIRISVNSVDHALLLDNLQTGAPAPASDAFWVSAVNGNWNDGSKWSGGSPPGPTDNALITVSGTYTVTVDANASVRSLTLGGSTGTQRLAGGTLTIGAESPIGGNGVLSVQTVDGVGIAGVGTLVIRGTLNMAASTVSAALVNEGTIDVVGSVGATSLINGGFSQAPSAVLRVNNPLKIANGFTNNGVIEIPSVGFADPTGRDISEVGGFEVSTGTLVNAPGSEIRATAGDRLSRVRAQVDNQGTITINGTTVFDKSGAVHFNSGIINVNRDLFQVEFGASFTNTASGEINATGGDLRFLRPTLTNAGKITLGAGRTLHIGGPTTFTQDGVLAGGGGFLKLQDGVTANFASAYSTATAALTVEGSTFNSSGVITNVPGTTLSLRAAVINAPVANEGTTDVGGPVGGTSFINGAFTQISGAVLRVNIPLKIASGFTNNGVIEIPAVGFADPTGRDISEVGGFEVSTGTLVNAPAGEIRATSGDRLSRVRAQVDNQGMINIDVNSAGILDKSGALHVNSGTINVNGRNLDVMSAATLTNTTSGRINITAGGSLRIAGASILHHDSGTIAGSGELLIDGELSGTAKLFGSGTIGPTVTLVRRAEISPGSPTPGSAGVLTIDGNLNLRSNNDVVMDVAGDSPGSGFDQLVVSGLADLQGRLKVLSMAGFAPCPGADLAILRYGFQTGQFAGGITWPNLLPEQSFQSTFGLNELTLEVTGPTPPECVVCQITTVSLPTLAIGQPASVQLTADCGTPPLTWSIVSGSPAPGLTLGPDGLLSGTPTAAGEFNFTARVENNQHHMAETTLTQRISLIAAPQVRLHKFGTRAVPGREIDWFILVENSGSAPAEAVGIVEYVQPLQTFLSGQPPQTRLQQVALRHGTEITTAEWDLPVIQPGDYTLLRYRTALDPRFPAGFFVTGCATTQENQADYLEAVNNCFSSFAAPCSSQASSGSGAACVGDPAPPPCLSCCLDRGPSECDEKPPVCAVDPNEKGVVAHRFIRSGQLLVYPIHFENIGSAEARDVFITDVLSQHLDASTLQVLSPDGTYQSGTRTLRWDMLGRNLEPGQGDFVLYAIRPSQGLPSGTEIRNAASIQFEVFTPLTTNEVVNIIDDIAPEGVMASLPPVSPRWIALSWSGTDQIGEIDTYQIFVSVGGGGFAPFLTTRETSTLFVAEPNRTYGFLCLATDTAGNIEAQDPVAEVVTTTTSTEDTTPPLLTIQSAPSPTTEATQLVRGTVGDLIIDGVRSLVASVTVNGLPALATGDTYVGAATLLEGANTITVVATDHAGNQSTQTTEIFLDRTPPTIAAPPNATVGTGAGAARCGALVADRALGAASASDNSGLVQVSRSGVPADRVFPVGVNAIIYIATDGVGQTASATQTVTVIDNTRPTIAAPAAASFQCASQVAPAVASQATAADNCGAPTVSVTEANNGGAGSPATPLVITRTYTATDAAGNSASASQTITVVDDTPPTITLSDRTVLSATLPAPAADVLRVPTATDNCGGPVTFANDAPESFPAGTTTVTWTATDSRGNSSTATQQIRVVPAATIEVEAALLTTGTGTNPGSTKTPLALDLKVFDRTAVGAPDPRDFGTTWADTTGVLVAPNVAMAGPTLVSTPAGEANLYTILVPSTDPANSDLASGSYLVIGQATVEGIVTYPGKPRDTLTTGSTARVYLQVIKTASGRIAAARTTEVQGSLLVASEPAYLEFTGIEELYPIVYESVEGDWNVRVTADPPPGFVSSPGTLSTELATNDARALQFTITDVGSEWTVTRVRHRILHKGREITVISEAGMVNRQTGRRPAKPDWVPTKYALLQNFPDPFNPETTLEFDLPEPAVVTLRVYDVAGRLVAALADRRRYEAGRQRVVFRPKGLGSGVYFYRLEAGKFVQTRRMVLLK